MPAEGRAKAAKEESSGGEKLGLVSVDIVPGRHLSGPPPLASRYGCSCGPELCAVVEKLARRDHLHFCPATCLVPYLNLYR